MTELLVYQLVGFALFFALLGAWRLVGRLLRRRQEKRHLQEAINRWSRHRWFERGH